MTDPIHPASGDLEAARFYAVKAAIERAMQDERNDEPCGCIIEAGCEARGYDDPSYAASGFIWQASEAAILAALRPDHMGEADNMMPANPPATAAGVGEAVAWERKHPTNGWRPVDPVDIDHYRACGQEIRALYTTPASHDALIARVREVLEPFAAVWQASGGVYPKAHPAWGFNHAGITWGDFHKARALLTDLDARDGG